MIHVPININLNPAKVGGELRFIVRNPDMTVDQDTGWFPNLLLDGGLIQMTTQTAWANDFHVGSSNTPPSVTDTALFAWLGVDNANITDSKINLGSPDYQGQTTRGRRFNAGNATGTLREIGINHLTSNTAMSIRALITPEITKSAEQILDAFYRFTAWPSLIDGTGIVNIFGDDYDYTVRMGNVQLLTSMFDSYRPAGPTSHHQAYNGVIGSTTELPSGDSANASAVNITNQAAGVCDYTVEYNIDSGNVAGGIRSIASRIVGGDNVDRPSIQVEFSNRGEGVGVLGSPIPKNNTREISFDLGITWSRH